MLKKPALSASVLLSVLSLLAPAAVQAEPAPLAPAQGRGIIATYALIVPTSVAPSGLIARAVLPAGVGCPQLLASVTARKGIKVVRAPMVERRPGATTLNAFGTLLVCEARMPVRAVRASISGRDVPASIPTKIDRIAVLSDSGCRIKGSTAQSCNDPEAWPFAEVSRSVVKDRPDVVINLGDYFYREEACPADAQEACGGSPEPLPGAPFTDSAWGWVADVLVPMAPVLESVPVLTIRGNHELCYRGGNGYFLLMDPAFGSAADCAPSADGVAPVVYSPTTAVDLDIRGGRTLRVVSVDSANGDDTAIDPVIAAAQRPLYVDARRLARGADESWLLTHRPIVGVVTTQFLPVPPGKATTWTSITNTYSSRGLLDRFDLTLSSHIHLAQAINVPTLPPELVLGNSGTDLEPPTGYVIPAYGPLADGEGQPLLPGLEQIPTAVSLQTWVRFGYALATPTDRGWRFELKGPSGSRFASCGLAAGSLTCR